MKMFDIYYADLSKNTVKNIFIFLRIYAIVYIIKVIGGKHHVKNQYPR